MSCIQESEESRRLVESLRSLLGTSATPWPRTFLIRILHAEHGSGILRSILHQESWHWILPPGINVAEMKTVSFSDNFLIYGAEYNDLIIKSLRNGADNKSFLRPYFEEIQVGSSDKLISLALAATRDLINKKASEEAKMLEAILGQREQYPALSHLTPVFEALLQKKLTSGFGKLSYTEIAHLVEVIIHAVLVIISTKTQLVQLLKSICLDPGKIRESYLPTMPEDNLFAANKMKKTENENLWECSCGEPWLVENCGEPWETGKCKCGANIGGQQHKAVEGFKKIDTSIDKTEKGYLLGGPETRKADEHERNLTASSFCISRVLLHASMLWGSLTDEQSIRKVMKVKQQNLCEFFCGHLQKDIEFLARYIGGNVDDAVLAIHLFLKFIFNHSKEIDLNIESTDNKDSRNKWEDCLKSTIQTFFQGFELTLNSAKQQITEHGPPALLKIIHGQPSLSHGFQNTELLNMNCIWRYEKRRTVEHLKHLLDQEDGKNNFPLLMELLNEQNIAYIKQLPDILHFQLYLIRLFQSCDPLKWKGKSIGQFLDSSDVTDEQRSAFKGAFRTIQRVWTLIRGTGVSAPSQGAVSELEDASPMQALLPTDGSVLYAVARALVVLQNRLIDTATSITKERKKVISAAEVKLYSVISCDPEKEVVPLALSNIQYVLDEDGTESALYNFRALQRQVMNQYISGKPAINAQTVPVVTLNKMTMNSTIKTVKEQMKIQIPMSISAIKRIMEDVKSVSDLSSVLAALKVAAEFLAVMGGDPECLITTYMSEQLKMSNEIKYFKDLPGVPQSQLKHILSLWQVLLARRSILLVEMNQNPFFFMASDFQGDLSPAEEAALTHSLSTVNIDNFILELHEMILICQERYRKDHGIAECFSYFLTGKNMDDAEVETLTSALEPELEMKTVLAVWKTAVKVRKRQTSQH